VDINIMVLTDGVFVVAVQGPDYQVPYRLEYANGPAYFLIDSVAQHFTPVQFFIGYEPIGHIIEVKPFNILRYHGVYVIPAQQDPDVATRHFTAA
jgi:hypothetical protein